MQLKHKNHRHCAAMQSGISLIELMIGITISLILMAGVITAFVNLSTSSATTVKSNRLNSELRNATNFITRELQKAGYVDAWDNPVTVPNSEDHRLRTDLLGLYGAISLGNNDGSACNASTDLGASLCNCILFQYDLDNDGIYGTNGTDIFTGPTDATSINSAEGEYFGFRLNNNVLQVKTSGAASTCSSGSWEGITSDDIQITALSFQIDHLDSFNDGTNYTTLEVGSGNDDDACDAGENCLDRRKVNVTITGVLTSDNSVTMTINTEVKLMNDRYFTGT